MRHWQTNITQWNILQSKCKLNIRIFVLIATNNTHLLYKTSAGQTFQSENKIASMWYSSTFLEMFTSSKNNGKYWFWKMLGSSNWTKEKERIMLKRVWHTPINHAKRYLENPKIKIKTQQTMLESHINHYPCH